VDVFNTHTCANYAHTYAPQPKGASWTAATDRDAPIRMAQIWQLSQLVNATRQAVSAGVATPHGAKLMWPSDISDGANAVCSHSNVAALSQALAPCASDAPLSANHAHRD